MSEFPCQKNSSRYFLARFFDSSISNLNNSTIQDETLMHLRQQCYFAEELKKIMSLNMDKVTKAIALFGNFVPS